MKKALIIVTAAILLCATSTFAFYKYTEIRGNGHLVTRTVSVQPFDAVSASRYVKVVLTSGTPGRLTIEADDNVIDYVVANVEKGELKIGIDAKINTVKNIHVTVTVPTDGRIESLEAEIVAEIWTRDIILTGTEVQFDASSYAQIDAVVHCTRFEAHASSAASIRADLVADLCKTKASSAAKIFLEGTARTSEADLNSASKLEASELVSASWHIDASSAAKARIHCTQTLDAEASSGASIVFSGDCTASTHASSGGSIHRS